MQWRKEFNLWHEYKIAAMETIRAMRDFGRIYSINFLSISLRSWLQLKFTSHITNTTEEILCHFHNTSRTSVILNNLFLCFRLFFEPMEPCRNDKSIHFIHSHSLHLFRLVRKCNLHVYPGLERNCQGVMMRKQRNSDVFILCNLWSLVDVTSIKTYTS